VHYVNRNALAGREFADVVAANEHLRRWAVEVAGLRDHGTTHRRPLEVFEAVERTQLQPLPPARYEVTTWKEAQVHRDGHAVLDYAYYSVPHRLVGERVWLKSTPRRVEVYTSGHERVATHPRALRRGEWVTSTDHLPPDKLEGLLPQPVVLRAQAQAVGPATAEWIERLLGDRPVDRVRTAHNALRLARRFGAPRLERACRRALAYGELRYQTLKTILQTGQDLDGVVDVTELPAPLPKTAQFARSAADYAGLVN